MIWFTSDTHFNHGLTSTGFNPDRNIMAYCPNRGENSLSGLETMNERLIYNWNRVVEPTDTIYHLGDFALGQKIHHAGFVKRLNGHKIIIRGNHDPKEAKLLADGWDEVYTQRFLHYTDTAGKTTTFWMAHVPPDNEEDHVPGRDLERPTTNEPWDIALCGHVHDAWRTRGKTINVGVDQWHYYPVSLDMIIDCAEVYCA